MKVCARIALSGVLVVAAGCSDSNTKTKITLPNCTEQVSGDFYIGDMMPFAGNELLFDSVDKSIELAVTEINAGGGVHGKTLGLIKCDDQASSNTGIAAMTGLAGVAGLGGVVGAPFSSVALAIAGKLNDLKKPLITPGATAPSLSGVSPFLFRSVPSDALQGVALAHIAHRQGYNKVFVPYRDDTYGLGLKAAFQTSFEGLGGTVASLAYDPTASTFTSAVIASAHTAVPDAILPVSYPTDGKAIIAQAAAESWTPALEWLFADSLNDPSLPTALGTAASSIEGSYGTVPSPPSGAAFVGFADRYQAAFTGQPGAFCANAYDGVYALAIAMQAAADPGDGALVRNSLAANVATTSGKQMLYGGDWTNIVKAIAADGAVDYQGTSGPLHFDSNGDVVANMQEWTVQGGAVTNVPASATGGCWAPSGTPCP
jgi:branched-chain amino acid transport system substrate-binding protein